VENLTIYHFFGILLVLAGIAFTSIYSGRKIKNSADFATGGGQLGASLIMGSLVGALVGGSSTIGIAQSAFSAGISACWFTLGIAAGCLAFGLGFYKPIRNNGSATLDEMLKNEFGNKASLILNIIMVICSFLPIVVQLVSASALLSSAFGVSPNAGSLIAMLLMLLVVFFGGVWGSGIVGAVKAVLLVFAILLCSAVALHPGGGLSAILDSLPRERYLNLFADGVGQGLSEGLSAMLGIVVGHNSIQAIIAGRSVRSVRIGSLLSALIIPFIGLGSVTVGMYMRVSFPEMVPLEAFPNFVLLKLPPLLSGIVLGVLLINTIAAGAAMSLPISTILVNSIYKPLNKNKGDDRRTLLVSRLIIFVCLSLALLVTFGEFKALLLQWIYLSMAMRTAAVLLPLSCALFLKGKVDRRIVVCASLLGVLTDVLGSTVITFPVSPIYLALALEAIFVAVSSAALKRYACNNKTA